MWFSRYLIFLVLHLMQVKADVGGHDLFTSLAQLEVLWKNEMEIVEVMKTAIAKMEIATEAMNKYIASHNALNLNKGPSYDFLGHPINAYHFVRHVASGWNKIHNQIVNDTLIDELTKLKEREKEKLPDAYDVQGAAYGLVRLHSLYKYDLEKFIHEGVISTTLDNGQVVLSDPSVQKLNAFDLVTMAEEGYGAYLFDSSTDFYQAALQVGKNEKVDTEPKYFSFKYSPSKVQKSFSLAKKVHDHHLDRAGPRSADHRCHQMPFDEKLRKKKKYKKAKKFDTILSRSKQIEYMDKQQKDSSYTSVMKNIVEQQKDALCRGQDLRPENVTSKLKCFYGHSGSPWLRIGPFKIEENSHDPYHVTIQELLFDHECNNVTEFLGPMLDFPPGRMKRNAAKNDWTMKNCWPDEHHNENLQKLNRRIEHITGLLANSYLNYSEPYMCGNYGIGGHYWIHPDYHQPRVTDYWPGNMGNRVATVLTVLENAEAGGATAWPFAGFAVWGKKGSGLFWHNLFASELQDQYTQHTACPILLGQKWIGNKWVGFNAQWNKRKCRLSPQHPFRAIRDFQKL